MLIKLSKIFFITLTLFIISLLNSKYYITANDNLAIEIDSPRFSEKGLDNRLYEIKAERGTQIDNMLTLHSVEGKLRTNSGLWIFLTSDVGIYNQSTNLIELKNNIIFYTDENDRFESDYAIFDMDTDLVEFNNNVRSFSGNNIIEANSSKINDNFNLMVYEGNVKTTYIIK